MPSKKWSSVHDHFHEISDYGLRCNHCYGTITSGNKTSNLKNHLKYRHPQKYAEVNDADRRHKDRGNVIDEEPANRSLVTTPTLQDAVQDEMLIYNPMFTLSGEQSTSTEIAAPMVVENYLQPQVTPSKSFRLNGTNRKRRIEENGAERARNELETERSAYKQKCMDLQIQLLEQKLEFKKAATEHTKFLLFRGKLELGMNCTYEDDGIRYTGRNRKLKSEPIEPLVPADEQSHLVNNQSNLVSNQSINPTAEVSTSTAISVDANNDEDQYANCGGFEVANNEESRITTRSRRQSNRKRQ